MDDVEKRVGYKRPPRERQFPPGKSGNPGGRPKGVKSFAADLLEELHETTTVTEGGHQIAISKQRAAVRALVAAAMKGSIPAANVLMMFAAKAQASEHAVEVADELTEDDRDVERASQSI